MTIKEIKARAFSHKSYDKNMRFLGYIALNGLKKETITEEEKQKALEEFKKLKQERIENIKRGKLVFVGMGMENDTEIGNFRIRTNILRKDGRRFFVEFTTGTDRETGKQRLFVDHSIDIDERDFYERKIKYYINKGLQNLTKEETIEYKKYKGQPYERYKTKEANKMLEGDYPHKKLILDVVNTIYGTEFETVEIENDLLTTDDYVSTDGF